ncbi:hypothetical protein [Dactylosporangium sp. CA-092794]|uniref:hypothetical protein n=1 Tax=Dactylosporangium sp. CA-092794 TaxID=3239929 RepID=UPI003D8EC9CD
MTEPDDAPISAGDLFATAELRSFEQVLGPTGVRSAPEGTIRFGRIHAREVHPELFPPAFRALSDYADWCFVRVVIPFELTPIAGEATEFGDATVAILYPGPDAVVLDLEPPRRAEDGGLIRALGPAPVPVAFDPADSPRALRPGIAVRTSGQGFNVMRWTLSQARGGALPAGGFVVAGVVQLPRDRTTFSGELAPQATAVRPLVRLRRPVPAWTLEKVPFEVPIVRLPDAPPPAPAPAPAAAVVAEPPLDDLEDGAQRLCLAVDIESYSARSTFGHCDAQRRLVEALDAAAETAGVGRELWQSQPQGDGLLAVLPAALNPLRFVPDLLHELRIALKETNRFVRAEARVRLRLGLHLGLVVQAANGFGGSAVIAACRLRDCGPVRALLREDPVTDLVVAVSPAFYRDVVQEEPRHLRASDFRPVTVELAGAGMTEAWISATA